MNIITVTLNPAIDVHYTVDSFEVNKYNTASTAHTESGGKGVNVSRVLSTLGVGSRAVILLPRSGKEEYMSALALDGCETVIIPCEGSVRRCLHINSKEGETILTSPVTCRDFLPLDHIRDAIFDGFSRGDIICFSGSIPELVRRDEVVELLRELSKAGARLLCDTRSLTLSELCNIHPYLIKPNEEELALLIGREFDKNDINSVKALKNVSELVLLTLGADGSVLYDSQNDKIIKATVPNVEAVSATAAGDSALAGFAAALLSGAELDRALILSSAASVAAVLTEGSAAPHLQLIKEQLDRIKITKP